MELQEGGLTQDDCELIAKHIAVELEHVACDAPAESIEWILVMTQERSGRLFTTSNMRPKGVASMSHAVRAEVRHRAFRATFRPRSEGGLLPFGAFAELVYYIAECIGELRIAWLFAAKAHDGDLLVHCNLRGPVEQIRFTEACLRAHQSRGEMSDDEAAERWRSVPFSGPARSAQ